MNQKKFSLMAAVLLVLLGLASTASAQLPRQQGPPPGGQPQAGQPQMIQPQTAPPQTVQPPFAQPPFGPPAAQPPGNEQPPLRFNPNEFRPGPSDPTIPSAEVRQMLEAGAAKPTVQGPPIPNLRIKGRVLSKNQPPAAIIDVNGRTLLVRMDTEIIYSGSSADQGTMTLKVIGLDTSGIRLQGGKQIWVLH